jgi:hypothetical protein
MMNRQPPGADTEPVDQRVPFRHPEAELLRLYGSHSLAFFGLAEDFEQFLAPGEQGLIAYRVVNRVAVALGDPLCAPQAVEAVTRSFLAFCRAQGFRVAFYQARPDYLAIYRTLHLHAFKMGEEAMLFPQTFSVQGPALAKVRTRCRHAQREGVQIQWYEGVLPAAVMQQLVSISDAWLESKGGRQTEETGFSTSHWLIPGRKWPNPGDTSSILPPAAWRYSSSARRSCASNRNLLPAGRAAAWSPVPGCPSPRLPWQCCAYAIMRGEDS